MNKKIPNQGFELDLDAETSKKLLSFLADQGLLQAAFEARESGGRGRDAAEAGFEARESGGRGRDAAEAGFEARESGGRGRDAAEAAFEARESGGRGLKLTISMKTDTDV